jgi:hypothetical protein
MLAMGLVVGLGAGSQAAFATALFPPITQGAGSSASDNDVQIANNDNKQVNEAKVKQKVGSSTGDKNKIFNLGGAGDTNTATATVTQGNTATNTAVNDDSGDTVTSSASNCASVAFLANALNCIDLGVNSTIGIGLDLLD